MLEIVASMLGQVIQRGKDHLSEHGLDSEGVFDTLQVIMNAQHDVTVKVLQERHPDLIERVHEAGVDGPGAALITLSYLLQTVSILEEWTSGNEGE